MSNRKSLEYTSVAVSEQDSEQHQSSPRPRRWNARRTIFLIVGATLALLLVSGWIRKYTITGNSGESAFDPNHEWVDDDAVTAVENPDSPNQSSSSSNKSCDPRLKCNTDRLGHKSPLYAGHAICNGNYVFGLTKEGVFLWHDCDTDKTNVFFKGSTDDVYFEMQPNADFTIHDVSTKEVLWKEKCTRTVDVTPKCLSEFDCPYLHLHRGGTLVLNYIDDDGNWKDLNVNRAYENLFPDRQL